jgi:hypothetical protein
VNAPDQLSLQIGIVQWLVILASIALVAVPALRRKLTAPASLVLLWLAVLAASLFMMAPLAVRVWEALPPLAYIQYPWRLLMLPTLACAMLAALLLSTVRHRTLQALIVLCVVVLQGYVTREYRAMAWDRQRAIMNIDDTGWVSDPEQRKWAFRTPGYDPVAVTRDDVSPTPHRWSVIHGRAHVDATDETDTSLGLAIRAEEPVTLVIDTPYFPGWRVWMDGRPIEPGIRAATGYMELPVPAGPHRIEATFEDTGVRTLANAITLATGALWILWLAWAFLAANHRVPSLVVRASVDEGGAPWSRRRVLPPAAGRVD